MYWPRNGGLSIAMANILSLQDWLFYEYDIDPDDWRRCDKKQKSELRREYEEYVKSETVKQ